MIYKIRTLRGLFRCGLLFLFLYSSLPVIWRSTAGCTFPVPVRCLVSSISLPYNSFANKSGGCFGRPSPGYVRDFYSSSGEGITDSEFNQWFTGFTDGEGHFSIAISQSNVIWFVFKIKLHIDDLGVLEFIKIDWIVVQSLSVKIIVISFT